MQKTNFDLQLGEMEVQNCKNTGKDYNFYWTSTVLLVMQSRFSFLMMFSNACTVLQWVGVRSVCTKQSLVSEIDLA